MTTPRRSAAAALGRVVALAATTRVLYEGARQVFGARPNLVRRNYRGRPVDLLGGPAVGIAVVGGVLIGGDLPARVRAAATIAGLAGAVAGGLDDAVGSSDARGFRGHLGVLRSGEVTTGVVKIGVIGAGAAAAGFLATRGGLVRRAAAGGVVALSANLANLLDLRPGRALKAATLVGVPLAASSKSIAARRIGVVAVGASAGLLPADLRERTMLGDAGANCLGALLGTAVVVDASGRRIAVALAGLAALTAASEFVSFSSVIEKNSVLRAIDRVGRSEGI